MSYKTLRDTCSMSGNALTSNEKFLPVNDPTYLKCCSNMLRYPGQKQTFTDGDFYEDPHHPARFAGYFGKDTMPGAGFPHPSVHPLPGTAHLHESSHAQPSQMKCCGKK